MRVQTEAAVRQAAVALLLVDARAGLVPLDEEIARWLRGSTTPIVLVANKAEGRADAAGVYEALELGRGAPVQLSAKTGEGMGRAGRGREGKECVSTGRTRWEP